jgi:RNA polymerase sigma-70 factor (ECF subfamily)
MGRMPDPADSDELLLRRYARGDASAFAALYRRHETRIWRYLMRTTGNRATAEELMQEVWFAVAREAGRYQPSARFTTWLFTIARNRMIDAGRLGRRQVSLDALGYDAPPVIEQLTAAAAGAPLAATMRMQEGAALAQALAQLPGEQRDAFLLHIEAELSVEEVALVTASSFETTKSRLRYARAKLRELLSEYA